MDTNIPAFILAVTASSGILFGLILLIKKLFKKQLSALLHYALWGILVIRLLMPFTFANVISPWDWFGTPQLQQIEQTISQTNEATYIPVSNIQNEKNGATALPGLEPLSLQQGQRAAHQPVSIPTSIPISNQKADPPVPFDWNLLALCVWGAGAAGVCTWLGTGFVRVRRKISRSILPAPVWMKETFEQCKGELGIKRRIRLVTQRALPVPAIMGLFKPMLVLPASLGSVSHEQLRHILLHELTHYRHGDIAINCLFNLLNAIYWWNPFAWLSFLLTRKDMETFCDNQVISRLGKERRQGYIATVLGFAGKSNHTRLQAAMSMSSRNYTRANQMKQRVHGMFMRKKTSLAVKIPVFLLVAAMLAAAFTTACQPTPVKPVIVNKGDGKLDQMIARNNIPRQKYSAPPDWKETVHSTINGTDITVDVDAGVEVPDTDAFPVVTIKPAQISYEQIQALLDEVAKDQKLYGAQFAEMTNTKEQIKGKIDYYTKELAGSQGEEYKDIRQQYENILKKLYKDLETAPENFAAAEDAVKSKLASRQNMQIKDGQAVPADGPTTDIGMVAVTKDNYRRGQGFELVIGEGYRPGTLRISASDNVRQQRMEYYRRGARGGSPSGSMELVSSLGIKQEQAEKEARRIATLLNTGLELTDVCAMTDYDFSGEKVKEVPVGYVFSFTRLYNGVPLKYSDNVGNWGMKAQEEILKEQYSEPWQDERLEISIGENGLEGLTYTSPATVVNTESENVALMPFEQIQETFRKQILLRPTWSELEQTTKVYAKLDRAVLTMVKVAKKDSPDEYRMIPAWDFCGNFKRAYIESGKEKESSLSNFYFRSFLTLNAVDGSVIEKERGY